MNKLELRDLILPKLQHEKFCAKSGPKAKCFCLVGDGLERTIDLLQEDPAVAQAWAELTYR